MSDINLSNLNKDLYKNSLNALSDNKLEKKELVSIIKEAQEHGITSDEKIFIAGILDKQNIDILKSQKPETQITNVSFVDDNLNSNLSELNNDITMINAGLSDKSIENFEKLTPETKTKFLELLDKGVVPSTCNEKNTLSSFVSIFKSNETDKNKLLSTLLDSDELTQKDSKNRSLLDNLDTINKALDGKLDVKTIEKFNNLSVKKSNFWEIGKDEEIKKDSNIQKGKFIDLLKSVDSKKEVISLLNNDMLMNSSFDGKTILDNLLELKTSKKQKGVNGKTLTEETINNLADRTNVIQGPHGTCGAASLEYVLLGKNPAEFTKIIKDLATNGVSVLQDKTMLHIAPNSLNYHKGSKTTDGSTEDRKDVDIIFQSAVMERVAIKKAVNPYSKYNVESDNSDLKSVLKGDSASNPIALKSLANSITGGNYKALFKVPKTDINIKTPAINFSTMKTDSHKILGLEIPSINIGNIGTPSSVFGHQIPSLKMKNLDISSHNINIKLESFDNFNTFSKLLLSANMHKDPIAMFTTDKSLHYVTVKNIKDNKVFFQNTASFGKSSLDSMSTDEFKKRLLSIITE